MQAAQRSSARLAKASSELVLQRKSVIKGSELTLAGVYALGDYPQQFFPSLKVSGVVQEDGARNLDKLETDGPPPEMLDVTVAWLTRNLRVAVIEDGQGGLKNRPEIPLIVLRKLVANALVHRALDRETAQSKDVIIRITADRVVITNPGGLWTITTATLDEPGHKTAVNPALYEICKLAQTPSGSRVIEGEGNGIYEAQKAMREAGLLPLQFIDKGFQFTAIIRRAPLAFTTETALPETSERSTEEIIWNHLTQTGEKTIPEIVEKTGLTRRQVAYNLNKLEDAGTVTSRRRAGERARYYRAV